MRLQLIEKQVIYDGKKVRLEVHHFDDESGHRIRKEIVVHPGAVVVMAFLPDGRLLLIRNHRYSVSQTLMELPAGTLDKGEDPMNCAGRELLEETGYLAGRLQRLASFFPSPGILTEKMHAFLAYDLVFEGQALEPGEEIEVVPAALDDVIEMIRTGQIVDAKTIAAVLMYERFHLSTAKS